MSKDQNNPSFVEKYLKFTNIPETFVAYVWFLLMIKTAYDKKL